MAIMSYGNIYGIMSLFNPTTMNIKWNKKMGIKDQ